jgi:hypothetical protein
VFGMDADNTSVTLVFFGLFVLLAIIAIVRAIRDVRMAKYNSGALHAKGLKEEPEGHKAKDHDFI